MSKYFEKHPATIRGLSHDGRGIAEINNKTTFIFGALPGESIEFRYTKFHRQFDEGTVLQILEPSPERIQPHCAFFGVCGGCSLQHLSPEKQREHKQAVLLEQLRHLAHASPTEILPPLHDEIWGYRHRARLSVHDVVKKNKVMVGFREQNSHRVADITRCEVLAPVVGDKIAEFSALFSTLKAKAQIPQVEIAVTDSHCALILRHLAPLCEEDLKKIEAFAEKNHFYIYLQPKGISSIIFNYPKKESFLLEYEIPHHQIRIQFQPWQFTQINPGLNLKMIDRAVELLEPQKNERILDLFCGIGNFTLPLARYCEQVIGVEGDSDAVSQAQKNAEHNRILNAEFFTANLFEDCENAPWAKSSYDKILLDPPRAGAQEIIPLLKRFKSSRIVYVSCNSATLARDTKLLLEMGYNLEKAGMMDMFPHTQHAEAIALFRKK